MSVSPAGIPRARAWYRRPAVALTAILVLAAVLRLMVFLDFRTRMPVDFTEFSELDNHTWHEFGKRVAGGDVLYRDAFNPVHTWAGRIAPAEQWTDWYGGPAAYYQAPLYGYMVGAVYAASGAEPDHVRIFQLVLGLVRVLLVYMIARRLFGGPVPLLAAFLAAIYTPALFFELTLLRVSFLTVIDLVAFLLLLVARDRRRPLWWAAAGLVGGFEFLAKPSILFLAAPVLILASERTPGSRARALTAYAAVFLIPIALLAARNIEVGQPPLQVSTRGPITFISGNAPDTETGGAVGFSVPPSSREILYRTHNRFLPTVAEVLRRHAHDPMRLARLTGSKARAFWRDYEVPNNVHFHHFRNVLGLLRIPFSTFGFVFPFAVLGVLATWRHRRRLWPLYLMSGLIFVYTVAFIVLARMRLTIVPYLILFAAAGLVWSARALAARNGKRIAFGVAIVLAALVWSTRPAGWAPTMMSSRLLFNDLAIYREYREQVAEEAERELSFEEARATLYDVKWSYENGRYAECVEPLTRVLESYPDLVFTRYVLARCHFELYLQDAARRDHLERARTELEGVLAREEDPPYARGLIDAMRNLETREEGDTP